MTDTPTPPELGRAVARIELDLREIKVDLKNQGQNYVARGEFEAWRTAIDREVKGIKDSIDKAITELKAARPAWWQVAPIITSVIAVVVVVFPSLTK